MLRDEEWSKWPQAQIAKACGVSREYVSRVLAKTEATCDRSQVAGADGRTINTANIGKARAPKAALANGIASPSLIDACRL